MSLSLLSCSAPETPMKIGTNLWLGYEPFYLAVKNGYLERQQTHFVEYTSASQVIMAYRNGVIDAAALTLDEALQLLENSFRPKIVLVLDISSGADVILGQPEITQFKQLKGKRVGVEDSALGAYVLSRALEMSGLSINDITVVSLEMSGHEQAFLNHEIDAVVTFEPIKSRLLAKSANVLFDSTQIPNEIVDILVVSQKYYENHRQTIDKLRLGWFKSLTYIEQHPANAVKIMRGRQHLSLEAFDQAFRGIYFPNREENDNLLNTNFNKSLLPTAQKLSKLMLDKHLLHHEINSENLFLTP